MVAVYIRVSTREQLTGYGLEVQRTQVLRYLQDQNIDLKSIQIYEDAGYSANSLSRPGLRRLIEDIKTKKIGKIYIYKLDRMFRNLKHQIELLEFFNRVGASLICITENIDYSSANGRLFVNIKGSVQQWERDSVSERTKDGIYQSALEGNYSKSTVPFGYRRKGKIIVPYEPEAKIVARVFDLYEELRCPYDTTLAAQLEFPEYRNKLKQRHIIKIISNMIYKGTFVLDKSEFENHTEAIISKEQFDRVQSFIPIMRVTKHRYYFNNLLFTQDNEKFSNTSGKSHTGQMHYYYKHKTTYLSEKKLFEILIKRYQDEYFNHTNQSKNSKHIKDLERKKQSIINLFVAGFITEDNYVATLKEITDAYGAILSNEKPEFSGNGSDREREIFTRKILSRVIYNTITNEIVFKFKTGFEIVEEY